MSTLRKGEASATSPALSNTCRAVLINEVSRRWNDINGVLLSDTLPRIVRELAEARRRGDTEITLNTLDFAATYIENLAKNLPGKDVAKLSAILDQIVQLARTLPSRNSLVKTEVLTKIGQAYQQVGQPEKAKLTLKLAAEASSGIQGNQIIAKAQVQLAVAWIALTQSPEATTALNHAVEQTGQVKDAYFRRETLSKIVKLYVQAGQPTLAWATLNLLSSQDYDRLITLPEIATAYIKIKNPASAKQILDPLLKQVLAIKDVEQREPQLMAIIVGYAPSGDFVKLQQIVAQMQRPNYYRGRAWFAIAGEARHWNQPQVRTQALSQLIADIKAANIVSQFGGRFDHEWYGELSSLAQSHNYQLELQDVITELRPINLLGIVLQDLINQKQFETARRMVPKPMPVQIDAAVTDESELWLDRIAIAQLQAGQPKPAETRINSEKLDVRRLIRFAQAFHQAGNRPLATLIFNRASAIAQTMSDQAAIANAMSKMGYSVELLLNSLATSLRTEPVMTKRAELLLSLSPEFLDARDAYFLVAERSGLAKQTEFITLARKTALSERRASEAYQFITSPQHSPSEHFDFVLQLVELHLSQGDFSSARSLLDLPIRTLLDAPESSKPPKEEISSVFYRTAMNLARAGSPEGAIALAQYVTPPKEREQLQQRLRCFI